MRHRPKQWKPLEIDATPKTTFAAKTAIQGASRRITRTYSKRKSTPNPATAAERPIKRQRTESSDLPPLPPPSDPKPVKKPPSTIDGYFFSSVSASSTRSSGSSSDGAFSGEAEADSPPSPPPARRWTSPRKLKFRPSLLPISGNEEYEAGGRGRKRNLDQEEGEGPDLSLKRRRGGPAGGRDNLDGPGGEEPGNTRTVSDEVGNGPGLLLAGPKSRTGQGEGEGDRKSSDGKSATKRASPSSTQDPASKPTGAENLGSAPPTYTMPYKFYLSATADTQPRAPQPATTKKPARTVQTTLNLSTKQPFKECKLCDTVYNPLHAVDVKLHQMQHARMLEEREGKGKGRKKG